MTLQILPETISPYVKPGLRKNKRCYGFPFNGVLSIVYKGQVLEALSFSNLTQRRKILVSWHRRYATHRKKKEPIYFHVKFKS